MLDPSNPMFAMLAKMMGGGIGGAPQLAGQQGAVMPPGAAAPMQMSMNPTQMQSANPGGGGYHFAPPPQPAPQQDPMGGGMSSMLPMMAAMGGGGGAGGGASGLMGLLGMAGSPGSQSLSVGGAPGIAPINTTVSGALPDLGAQQGGIHGLWHSLFGG